MVEVERPDQILQVFRGTGIRQGFAGIAKRTALMGKSFRALANGQCVGFIQILRHNTGNFHIIGAVVIGFRCNGTAVEPESIIGNTSVQPEDTTLCNGGFQQESQSINSIQTNRPETFRAIFSVFFQ